MTRALTRLILLLVTAAGFMGMAAPTAHAGGHGGGYIEVEGISGVPVPPLAHGYLDVLDTNRSAVQALAREVLADDATAMRLNAYTDRQLAAAWWGVVPFGREEGSPFHRPMHAYLAATEALLTRMTTLLPGNPDVQALATKVAYDRAHSEPVQIVCRYSGEPFNTAQTVDVDWNKALTHWPTMTLLGILALLGLAVAVEVAHRTRRQPDDRTSATDRYGLAGA